MKCKIRGCSSSTLLNVVVKTTFHTIPSSYKDPHRHAIWKRFIDLEVRNGMKEKCFKTRVNSLEYMFLLGGNFMPGTEKL